MVTIFTVIKIGIIIATFLHVNTYYFVERIFSVAGGWYLCSGPGAKEALLPMTFTRWTGAMNPAFWRKRWRG